MSDSGHDGVSDRVKRWANPPASRGSDAAGTKGAPTKAPARVRFGRALVAVDLLVLVTVLSACLFASWGFRSIEPEDFPRIFMMLCFVAVWPAMLWQKQTRTSTILGSGPEEYRRVLVASGWATCLVATVLYLSDTMRGRMFFVTVALLATLGLLLGRSVMRRMLVKQLAGSRSLHRIFVIADDAGFQAISQQLGDADEMYRITGSWNFSQGPTDADALVSAASETGADSIIYVPGAHGEPNVSRELAWAMERSDLSLFISPALVDVAGPRVSVEPVRGIVLLRVEQPRFSGPARVVKRVIDVFGSALLLLVLGIPMLLIGLWIRLDSKGPALFRQPRVGVDGRVFNCWKFRTMYTDADSKRDELRAAHGGTGATFKLEKDPRVTKIGHFLRRFSIDELPQLVNVFRSDMGLVGPRPHPLDDVSRYDDLALRRLLVKPGMTGLWQVSGRSDLSWDESVTLDLYYVENWSLSLDVIIMGRTVAAVLRGSGSY